MSVRGILSFVVLSVFLSAIVFAQVDTQSPQWFDQSGPNGSAPGKILTLKARWTDNIALDTATLKVTWPNGTFEERYFDMSGLEDTSVFLYTTPDFPLGSKFKWSITANDTHNNKNTTSELEFLMKDIETPKYQNLSQSRDVLQVGDTVLLSAKLTDDYGLSSAIFYTNETGAFKARRIYTPTGKEADVSLLWVNESLQLGAIVGWYIEFNDTAGNSQKTLTKSFALRACPVCPSDQPWSDCANNLQTRKIYECGAGTNYICKEVMNNQTCTVSVKRVDADTALSTAEDSIDNATTNNKDTTVAEKLLEQANDAYNKGDYGTAISLAGQAKDAALSAESKGVPGKKEVPSEKGADVLPYVIILIAIGVVVFYLYKTGKLHLPVSKKVEDETEVPEEEFAAEETSGETATTKEEPSRSSTCSVCGKTFSTLYDCEECGTKVCFNDARTYKGKIYCLNDLRKKGLI